MRFVLTLFLTMPLLARAAEVPSLQFVPETASTAVSAHVAKAKESRGG